MGGRGDGGAFNEGILEGLRPNFFELLSQEAMHDALRPACQYFIKVSLTGAWYLLLWRPLTNNFTDIGAEQTRPTGPGVEVC